MSKLACAGISVITIVGLCLASAMQAPKPIPNAIQKGPAMAGHASGTFEVKLNPQPPEDKTEGSTLGRMLMRNFDEQRVATVHHRGAGLG